MAEPTLKAPATDTPNADEATLSDFIGNFHKTLPHDQAGQVFPADYQTFSQIARGVHPTFGDDFDKTPRGQGTATPSTHPTPANQAPFLKTPPDVARLTSPQAGRAMSDLLGPDPLQLTMPPAPGVRSDSTAAEISELFWMARLRDTPFDDFNSDGVVAQAVQGLKANFTTALASGAGDPGALQLGRDLPDAGGQLNLTGKTLFRLGLKDEEFGPLVSQFMLQDLNYGAQLIRQVQIPYRKDRNYLVKFSDWLRVQNTGSDAYGQSYGTANNFDDDPGYFETPKKRFRIRNMRDLARFVNRDALHQAYFNAALQLTGWDADVDCGNPYRDYKRQAKFASLGGPDLLALVSEVASRALKVVWRQKWQVHRRLRPEAYGGLMQVQKIGAIGKNGKVIQQIDHGLPDWLFSTGGVAWAHERYGTYLLPMAYSAGSPPHPAYGAGHATVAGACVTILKAWFDESKAFKDILKPTSGADPSPFGDNAGPQIVEPGAHAAGQPLKPYTGADRNKMTVGGELNKLAANVAMGRSMGGVHFRSDNSRSLRLGEQIATVMLARLTRTYKEAGLTFSYTSFDRQSVKITPTGVTVTGPNAAALQALYLAIL
jgi:hypothetical protein